MSLADEMLRLVKYPPERLIESMFIVTIGGNASVMHFQLPNIEPTGYLVWIRNVGMARNASLQVSLEGQIADRRYENIFPYGAAWPVLDDKTPLDVPFDYEAFFEFTNLTGVAVPNYQARVVFEVQPYRVADKIALGVSEAAMSTEELRLAREYLIREKVKTGELPMPYPLGAIQERYVGQYSGNPALGSETTLLEKAVPEDHKVCLHYLWCSHPAANFGDLEIRVYRDKRRFLTIYPYMMPNWTTATRKIPPLDIWIPCLNQLRVTLYSGTGHVGILSQVEAELRKLTIFDKIAWNLNLSDDERSLTDRLNLRDKLDAGIYTLYTPMTGGALGRR